MPAVVGVPLRMPVTVFRVIPGGKEAAMIVGVGKPVALTTNVPGVPTMNVLLAALVNAGAECAGNSEVGGKATTTSLNCFVEPPIPASTGCVGL